MEKRTLLAVVIVISTGLAASMLSRAEAQVSLDVVLKACEKKTPVFGEYGFEVRRQVGEKINDYCEGFLQGVFTVLVRAHTICVEERNTSPDVLLSIVLTYRTETKSQDDDAASVIEAAFKRAFGCTD